jgi:hypothetical protein
MALQKSTANQEISKTLLYKAERSPLRPDFLLGYVYIPIIN